MKLNSWKNPNLNPLTQREGTQDFFVAPNS